MIQITPLGLVDECMAILREQMEPHIDNLLLAARCGDELAVEKLHVLDRLYRRAEKTLEDVDPCVVNSPFDSLFRLPVLLVLSSSFMPSCGQLRQVGCHPGLAENAFQNEISPPAPAYLLCDVRVGRNLGSPRSHRGFNFPELVAFTREMGSELPSPSLVIADETTYQGSHKGYSSYNAALSKNQTGQMMVTSSHEILRASGNKPVLRAVASRKVILP